LPIITASSGGSIIVDENSTLTLDAEKITMEAGSSIKIKEGSELNGSYVFPSQTRLSTSGNCMIGGDFTFSDISRMSIGGSNINDYNPQVRLTSSVNMSTGSTLWLDYGSELIIEEGATLSLTGPMKVVACRGSKITVNGGTLETDETGGAIEWTTNIYEPEPDKEDGPWVGIVAEVGSTLIIRGSNFIGASKAISGTPASLTLENCTFTECENGIDLINCNNYTIENNNFTGVGIGSGIALTQSEGVLSGNSVSGFSHGIDITLCSPMLSKNTIFGNSNYGVCILGYNANPQFINPNVSQNYLNNEIYDNGIAQIYLKYSASAYMTNGKNNIYSGASGVIPEVPCIMGVSNTAPTTKVALPSRVYIDAEYNYWGYSDIETYEDSFFDLWTMSTYNGYRIAYQPYSTVPYRSENQIPDASLSAHNSPDPGSILLNNAIKQELNGKYTSSINLYEKVIDKYDSTAEAQVALARLPYVYFQQELATEPVIKLYDDALASDETTNKKFFKEMKVSTLLKAKKYNDAKSISIEMREEAESEGEILLAEIDIAIAEMMMNAQNRGKSSSNANSTDISSLISKLTGSEDKTEPAFANKNTLPSVVTLHQNYPNPFNPVTQIKFALAKTADVKLSIYNINGQKLAELANGVMNAGAHSFEFDGSRFNSGVYYYTLEAEGRTFTQKMILMK
jgi:hypothetical protein